MGKLEQNIAKNVVKALGIKNDDILLVETNERMVELADEIAFTARKLGAETLTKLYTEKLWLKSVTELDVAWLREPDKNADALTDVVTATVYMGGVSDPRKFRLISKERWEANAVGAEKTYKRLKEKKPRSLELGLSMLTPQRAKAYGFNFKAWKNSVTAAISADYRKISEEGKKIRPLLENGKTVQITGKGTDLRFELVGRKVRIFDGLIDNEDIALGNVTISLPDGALGIAPKEESAEGTITFDMPIPMYGKLIKGLKWKFEKGMLVDYTAEKNLDIYKMSMKNEEKVENGLRFGKFGLGLNPKAQPGYLQNYIVRGAISVGIGNNEEFGGANVTGSGTWATLCKGTVTIDGKVLVNNGKLEIRN